MGRKKVPDELRQKTLVAAMLTPPQAAAWRAALGPGEKPSSVLRDLILRDLRRRVKKQTKVENVTAAPGTKETAENET